MDSISDMLARIRNAQAVGHETVEVPYSGVVWEVARTLAKAGFVKEVEKSGRKEKRTILITLKYSPEKEPAIRILRRVSKPSFRVYVKKNELFTSKGGRRRIVSTSKGIMTDLEAKKLGLGGEVICEVM